MNRDQMMQVQFIEEQSNQLNSQLELIDQNIIELNELKKSLDEIEKNESKEILANLGKRIYVPVEIKEKKLVVEVGNKSYVRKTIPDTKKLIDEQLGKLEEGKHRVVLTLEELQEKAAELMLEIEHKEEEKREKGKKE